MDSKESKNSTSKILRDRYARILGQDWTPPSSVVTAKKRRLLRWLVWIPVLLILVLGTHYFTNRQTEITKSEQKTTSYPPQKQETSSIPELPPLPDYVASIANSIISEQNDSDITILKTPVTNDTVNHERLKNVEIQDKSPDNTTKAENGGETQFFVIVKSTKSKDEAIAYAKELGARGYASEVILSSANYYGVVLGRFSFEDAKRAINAALVSGIITNEPYLMTPDRVIDYVYPKDISPSVNRGLPDN
jgi:hypothetical protein